MCVCMFVYISVCMCVCVYVCELLRKRGREKLILKKAIRKDYFG